MSSSIWDSDDFSSLLGSTYSDFSFKQIATLLSKAVDYDNDLCLNDEKVVESEEEKSENEKKYVIELLKGGFEEKCGISFDRFINIYNEILETNPEKLI